MAEVGPYALHEPIGEGGMAQVFRAVGPEGEEVAVKLLHGGAGASEEQLVRFEREIRAAEGIDHPHLIAVTDHGVDPERGPYLVMPLVRGMTLRDLFGGKRLSPEAALLLLYPLADALAALHAQGLVHRDVKPENLMLSPLGDVTLVDLGLALAETDTRYTREGEVAGSVPYMAPERIEGLDVDASADVWAFAVLLYELIAGKRPFERGRAGEEVAAILAGSFPSLAEVDRRCSEELDWLVGVCLSPDPWSRPRDGAALLERLRPLVHGALEDARDHRVSVLSDPEGFERRIAPEVVAGLREEARELMARGDALDAIRRLDRALAYLPDDEQTLALVELASSGEAVEVEARPAVQTAKVERPSSLRRWIVLAALGVLTAAAMAGAWVIRSNRAAPPEPEPEPVAAAEAHDAGAEPDAGAEVAALEYHPIPPNLLHNAHTPDLRAAAAPPGEPLVEATAFDDDPEIELAEAIRALEDDPDDAHEAARRMMALYALGRTREADRAAAELEREHPDAPEALTARGYVAMRRGDFDEADALLTRAIERRPEYEDALRHRGVLRVRRGQTRDGYLDLQRVLAIDPDNLNALAEMTEVYQRAHRPADAAPFLRRIVTGHPRAATAWVSLSIALSQSRDPDDIDEAVEAVERGLELEPDHVDGLRQRCTVLSRNERAGVIPACTRAIEAAPQDPDLFMARAVQLSRQNDHVPAIADADRAIEIAPELPRLYANRAILRGRAGDEDGAYTDLRTACQLGHARSCSRLQADGMNLAGRPP